MKHFIVITVMGLLASIQAQAFLTAPSQYACKDGRYLSIDHEMGRGEFSMNLYANDGDSYYEGSILMKSSKTADLFHSEGDKVGTIRSLGANMIEMNADDLFTTCSKL